MAQDAVKPICYFALKETDPLFGEAGRTIDSEIYDVLPVETRNKFKPCMKPLNRKPSWHPSNIEGTIAMAEIPMPMGFADPDEDPDEDLEDEEHDEDDDNNF
jgi:hypothetical protein